MEAPAGAASDALAPLVDDGGSPRARADSARDAPTPSAEEPGVAPALGSSLARIDAAGLPLPAAEARRTSLRRIEEERALLPHEGLVRQHFGGVIPSPLEAQTAPLPGDRRAFLLYGEPRRREPFLMVLAASPGGHLETPREVLWTKERPLAGTRQVVTEMVVAGGPHGEVCLIWCDIPTQIVGLRKWSAEGIVLADFEVIEVDVCEALSALYWPGRGWVTVASQHGPARAELLDEQGRRVWGPKGIDLPWSARPSAPSSLVVDSDASVVLLQVGDLRRGEGVAPDRVLAMRFDTLGTPLWDHALDLGPAPGAGAPLGAGPLSGAPRITAARTEPGKVRVSLGTRGAAIVTSSGAILTR
jgi:hypothetical protein